MCFEVGNRRRREMGEKLGRDGGPYTSWRSTINFADQSLPLPNGGVYLWPRVQAQARQSMAPQQDGKACVSPGQIV